MMRRFLRNGNLIWLTVWALATAANLFKAVHIDDTAYLEMARAIVANPLHPMSGMVNWYDTAAPIHNLNQPPLLSYLLAGVMRLGGESEAAFHLVIAAFAAAALFFFDRLAARATGARVWPRFFFCATFGLGPVFLPGQNIMVDVPMAAFWMICLWGLVRAADGPARGRMYLIAGLAAGAACLTKYYSLALLPAMAGVILLRRDWRYLVSLALPAAMLALWSLFNLYDYGGAHLFGRPVAEFNKLDRKLAEALMTLGAIAPFSLILLPHLWARPKRRWALLAAAGAGLLSLAFGTKGMNWAYVPLRALFIANGALAGIAAGMLLWRGIRGRTGTEGAVNGEGAGRAGRDPLIVYGLTLAAAGLFILLLAPFMATRHFMVIAPVMLLIIAHGLPRATAGGWARAALAASLALGTILAASDWVYADVYRRAARYLGEQLRPTERAVWCVGHWGWQWYAQREGMRVYDNERSEPRPGDVVVVAETVSKQGAREEDKKRLRGLGIITIPTGPLTWIRTGWPAAGYYSCSLRRLPWAPSPNPLEGFEVFEVMPRGDEPWATAFSP